MLVPPEQKIEALKVLSEHLLDPGKELWCCYSDKRVVNRQEILTAFPPVPILRQQIQEILDNVRGSSHVYGRIKVKRCADTSKRLLLIFKLVLYS